MEQQVAQPRSAFPPPPAVWALYESDHSQNMTDLPEETGTQQQRQLWTPPPPLQENFPKFGTIHSNEYWTHDLGDQVPKLFEEDESNPDGDVVQRIQFVPELRKLLRQLARQYLVVLDDIRNGGEMVQEGQVSRLKSTLELSHIFRNISHLLNLLRGHQARQTLIVALQEQIAERERKSQRLEELVTMCQGFLEQHSFKS
eukprot:TRINITY_DN32843_c0_g1_i1.p1 TRINITY_DN32843_c0_g1~~TRINITY_DN32843_c0_g1_i1.p1  ORF type:complete len:200 (-),score=43.73 TRINITY_DN32843_c0_g1_i1:516-1115(-)